MKVKLTATKLQNKGEQMVFFAELKSRFIWSTQYSFKI